MSFSAGKVFVVGGIHGNEMSGVYAIKNWLSEGSNLPPSLQRRGVGEVRAVLANPLAVRKCLRFVDSDLNAAFDKTKWNQEGELINAGDKEDNEAALAPKLHREFGGGDFCIHLHCATSNSDVILLVSKADPVALKVARFVQVNLTSPYQVRVVIVEPRPTSLRNMFPSGIGVEVGPQPQGMLLAEMLRLHKEVVNLVLDGLSQVALKTADCSSECDSLEVFEPIGVVPFPRDAEGDLKAAIHPEFQGKDFQLLHANVPIFKEFNGQDIVHQGEPCYPVFVNESAYYSRDSAFWMTKKTQIKLV